MKVPPLLRIRVTRDLLARAPVPRLGDAVNSELHYLPPLRPIIPDGKARDRSCRTLRMAQWHSEPDAQAWIYEQS